MLTLAAQVVHRRLPCTDQIAYRLVHRVRHPNPGQLARPVQPCQRDGVAPVCLDPLTGPFRDQGRSDHQTVVTEFLDLPTQPVTCRTRFKADLQSAVPSGKLLDGPLDPRRRVLHLAQEPDLASAASLGDRHRMLGLGDVERDKSPAMLPHGSPSVREARLGPSEQPSFLLSHEGRAASLTRGT